MKCKYCNKNITKGNLKRHEEACQNNPINKCPVCGNGKPTPTQLTCSRECRLIYCGPPNKPSLEETSNYRRICFHYHGNKCIICSEENIVAVHHLDEDHNNNEPCNLCPLCLTHHGYIHSKFKHLIEEKVYMFVLKQCKHMWE